MQRREEDDRHFDAACMEIVGSRMAMTDSRVRLPGGRELAYTGIGHPEGRSLLFFHGAPMSRWHLVGLDERFSERDLRVISPDRPGYGRSSPQPGRSMADWPSDVAALADALGIERFLVAGHSSGGPYAVVCGCSLPERVIGGVVLGGVTDMAWPAAWSGYLEDEIRLMRAPDERTTIARCVEQIGPDGRGFLESPFALPEPDLAFFGDETRQRALMATAEEAFRQGVSGYAQDVHVQGRPWPFDPSRISAPFEIVHGELDDLVPVAHSRHTAELIPTATFRLLPGHGHFTTLPELPDLASALSP